MADLLDSYGEDLHKRWDFHEGPTSTERFLAEQAALGSPEPNAEGKQLNGGEGSINPTLKKIAESTPPNPLEALSAIGETLGAPLRMLLVKTLTGADPTATGKDGQYTGEDFKTQLGLAGPETPLGKQALGLGAEILTDPTSALPIAGKGTGKVAQAAGEGVAKGAQAALKALKDTADSKKLADNLGKVVPEESLINDATKVPEVSPAQQVEDLIKADPTMSPKKASIMRESVGIPTSAHGKHARAVFRQKSGEDFPVVDDVTAKAFNYKVGDGDLSLKQYQFIQDITREEAARSGVSVNAYQDAFRSATEFIEKNPAVIEQIGNFFAKNPVVAAQVSDSAVASARALALDEKGGIKLGAAMLMARVIAGAAIGGYASEDTLTGMLAGAGIAVSPEALAPLLKKMKAAPIPKKAAVPRPPSWKPGYAEQRFAQLRQELIKKRKADVARPLTQVEEEAKALMGYQDVSLETLKRISPNAVMDDASMRAAQLVLKESAEHLQQMARMADIGNPDDVTDVLRQLYAHGNSDFGRQYAEGGIGRALNVIDANEADRAFLNQMSRIVDEAASGVNGQRIVELIRQTSDADHLAKFANSMSKAGFKDMAVEYWTNGLLSGLKTWTLNPISSTMFHGLNMFERGMSVLYGNGTGPQEAIAMFQGSMSALKEAWALSWRMMKDESAQSIMSGNKIEMFHPAITAENVKNLSPIKTLTDVLEDKFSNGKYGPIASAIDYLGHVATKATDAAGRAIRIPRRVILAQDEFMKAIAQRAEIHAQAVRNASSDVEAAGLTGSAARKLYTERFQHWIENPSADSMRKAKDYSAYITFTNELGTTGKAAREFANSSLVGKAMLPFITAPVNITKTGFLERTPLGLLSKTFRDEVNAGGTRKQLALTRMSTGAAFMAMATEWAVNGFITGPSAEDYQLNKAAKQTGRLPFAINLSAIQRGGPANAQNKPLAGDTLIDITRLDPAIAPALVFASLYASYRARMAEEDVDAVALELSLAIGEYVGDKSWFAGAAGVADLMSDPSKNYDKFLKRQLGTAVPFSSFSGALAREVDPIKRDPFTLWDSILVKLPYLSTKVIPDRNRYGEVVHYPPALGPDMASPFYSDTVKEDKVMDAMIEDQYNIEPLPKKIQGVALSAEEYDQLRVIFGQEVVDANGHTLRQAEEAILKQTKAEWQTTGPDSWRTNAFHKMEADLRDKAIMVLLRRNPELAQRVVDAHREKVERKGGFSNMMFRIEAADNDGLDVKSGKSKAGKIPFTVR